MRDDVKFLGRGVFILYGAVIGALAAAAAWFYLYAVKFVSSFLWEDIPAFFKTEVNIPQLAIFFPILFGVIGGLLIAIIRYHNGPIVKTASEIEHEFAHNHKYEFGNILVLFLATTVPLVFGAAVDPEVAIISLVASLTIIIVNRIKTLRESAFELTQLSVGTSISMLFGSPLFGYSIVENEEISKLSRNKFKSFLYLITIAAGLMVYILLDNTVGHVLTIHGDAHHGVFNIRFPNVIGNGPDGALSVTDYGFLVLFAVIGLILGFIFGLFEKLFDIMFAFKKHKFINRYVIPVLAGVVIGLVAVYFHEALGSGKYDLKYLIKDGYGVKMPDKKGWDIFNLIYDNFKSLTKDQVLILSLLGLGLFKIIFSAFCLTTGWKGGEIFPLMFGSALVGYGLGEYFNVDHTASAAVVIMATTSFVTKKPIAIFMLLIMFFPPETFLLLMFVMILANVFPKPAFLEHDPEHIAHDNQHELEEIVERKKLIAEKKTDGKKRKEEIEREKLLEQKKKAVNSDKKDTKKKTESKDNKDSKKKESDKKSDTKDKKSNTKDKKDSKKK